MIRAALLLAIAATALAQTNPPKPQATLPPASGSTTAAPPAQTSPAKPAVTPRKPAVSAILPNYNELKYPELKPIASPAIEDVTLPNGMRLLLLENHELPLVSGTLLVRTGGAFDPPEKIGLAALTAQVLLESGTTTKPGVELVRRFQGLGAEIDDSVTENMLSISFLGLKANTDQVLDALKDGMTASEFPQERIEFSKTRLRYTIAHRNDDGAAILRREFAATVFGKGSPYGAQVEYADVDRINRGDLVSFYRRYFFPKNVTLALEGDFDPAAIKERVAALFGDWKSEQAPVAEFPAVGITGAPGKFLAVKKDASHSYFAVGQAAGDYLDKDYPALEVMARILGNGPQSRLYLLLHGSVDGLAASWAPAFGHPGLFKVTGTVVNPFLTTKVLQTVYDELTKMRTEQVSEQELKAAKASVLNSLVFAYDSQLSILPRLAEYQYFGFPGDYTQQHQKALEGVTRADVLRVARERLDPAKMTTVVVANPTSFEEPLESLGGSAASVIDLTIPPRKVEAALGDAASLSRGKQLLVRAQQAMGGAEKLAATADYVEEMVYQFDVSAGGAQSIMTERWIAPGYVRQDNTTAAGKLSVYCDGKAGWIASEQASSALAGVQLKQVQSDLFRTLFQLLLSDRMPARKVIAIDDQTVEISDDGGQIVKLVFDAATGLVKNVLYDAVTQAGAVSVLETDMDYRDVSGMEVPYKIAITVSGKKFQDLTIKSMKINTGLKIQYLEKRP